MRLMIALLVLLIGLNESQAKVSRKIIKEIARECEVPAVLLEAICQVESNLEPHAINMGGKAYFFKNRELAAKFLVSQIELGKTNIDVGCMQINWRWHGRHLQDPDLLLDERACLYYGATLLKVLAKQKGGWVQAMMYYHSSNPKAQAKYLEKVQKALDLESSEKGGAV